MVKVVKYMSEVTAGPGAVCNEKLPGCDVSSGLLHVCFDDGSGVTVCRKCFDAHLNDQGDWITDSCVELAS